MATGATEYLTVTNSAGSTNDVSSHVPELWSKWTLIAREANTILAPMVDRRLEPELMKFGDKIHVPGVSNLSARSKSQEAAVDFENQAEADNTLDVNQWYYSAIAIESFADVQTKGDMLQMYSGKLAFALALNVDDVLAGLIDDVSTNTLGSWASELSTQDFQDAIRYLDDANVPDDGRFFYLSPIEAMGMLNKERMISNDYARLFGDSKVKVQRDKAYQTSFLGVPAFKSTNVEGTNAAGHDNALIHKEAFQLVMQLNPKTHVQFDIDYIVDKVVMEQIYGTATHREDHAVLMRGA
jgi:hypothetical protein